jgi:hypothetical protein
MAYVKNGFILSKLVDSLATMSSIIETQSIYNSDDEYYEHEFIVFYDVDDDDEEFILEDDDYDSEYEDCLDYIDWVQQMDYD